MESRATDVYRNVLTYKLYESCGICNTISKCNLPQLIHNFHHGIYREEETGAGGRPPPPPLAPCPRPHLNHNIAILPACTIGIQKLWYTGLDSVCVVVYRVGRAVQWDLNQL